MKIRVTNDAASDLETIKAYIADDDGAAAERVVEQIRATIGVLARWPRFGHPGIVAGTFERSVSRTSYVIVYRIDIGDAGEELIVLRVPHGAQDRTHLTDA